MKNIFLILAVIASLTSCKKGDNDPFISLKSRKGRLSGDWKVKNATYTYNDTLWVYDGSTLIKSLAGVEINRVKVEQTFKFDKSGDYTIEKSTVYPEDYFAPQTQEVTATYLEVGIWNFTGGAGDSKTKSKLLLQPERIEKKVEGFDDVEAQAWVNPLYGRIINLDMLKNKEMRWKYDYTENVPTGKTTETGIWEFEKE